jgi:hypothetical protein
VLRSRSRYLQAQPDEVHRLAATIRDPLTGMLDLLDVEPVTSADVGQMLTEMAASGLVPRDALANLIALATTSSGDSLSSRKC